MLQVGMKGEARTVCCAENTAKKMKSGTLEVFATPAMTALMEEAAAGSVAPCLEAGQTTVGTMLNIQHSSATPVGMAVRCESELIELDGRRLVFSVTAYDDCGEIGRGTHERFIIHSEKFLAKANAKIKQ